MVIENIAILFIVIVAVLHCLFFKLESLDFMKPKVLKKFGLSEQNGALVKVWAFNQGFYNLFLALGLFYSVYLLKSGQVISGHLLASFILLTITGAGIVLYLSEPKKINAAIVQGIPALIGFLLLQI